MQLIDTHVHINFDSFQPDLEAVAERWRDAGVVRLVHSCVEPSEFPGDPIAVRSDSRSYSSQSDFTRWMSLRRWTEERAAEILSLAESDSRVVAIGETGLDLFQSQQPGAATAGV